jgi:hypothetical protein
MNNSKKITVVHQHNYPLWSLLALVEQIIGGWWMVDSFHDGVDGGIYVTSI